VVTSILTAYDFGGAPAARGKSLYSKHCATCHGEALEGGGAPALSGTAFLEAWGRPTRTVDDLFYIMRSSMPRPAIGSLAPSEYLDLLAFVLSRNGLLKESTHL